MVWNSTMKVWYIVWNGRKATAVDFAAWVWVFTDRSIAVISPRHTNDSQFIACIQTYRSEPKRNEIKKREFILFAFYVHALWSGLSFSAITYFTMGDGAHAKMKREHVENVERRKGIDFKGTGDWLKIPHLAHAHRPANGSFRAVT